MASFEEEFLDIKDVLIKEEIWHEQGLAFAFGNDKAFQEFIERNCVVPTGSVPQLVKSWTRLHQRCKNKAQVMGRFLAQEHKVGVDEAPLSKKVLSIAPVPLPHILRTAVVLKYMLRCTHQPEAPELMEQMQVSMLALVYARHYFILSFFPKSGCQAHQTLGIHMDQ